MDTTKALASVDPLMALRMHLMCALTADKFGKDDVVYDAVSQAYVLYEDEISDPRQQVEFVTVFTGTLRSLTRCTVETYDNLVSKATLYAIRPSISLPICNNLCMYGAKLLKKDQIPAVYCQLPVLTAFRIPHAAAPSGTAARTCSGTRSAASRMARGQWTVCGFVVAPLELHSHYSHDAADNCSSLRFTRSPRRRLARLRRTCSRARAAVALPVSGFICKFSSATCTSTTKVRLLQLRRLVLFRPLLRPRVQACLGLMPASSMSCSSAFRAACLPSIPRAR
jgi:hypothetical protein